MSREIEVKLANGDSLTAEESAIVSRDPRLKSFAKDVERINSLALQAQAVTLPPHSSAYPAHKKAGWQGVLVAFAVLAVLALPIANVSLQRLANRATVSPKDNSVAQGGLPVSIQGYVAILKRKNERVPFRWVEVAREERDGNRSTFTVHEGPRVYITECSWSDDGSELRLRRADGSDGGPYSKSSDNGPDVREFPFAAATSKEAAARYYFGEAADSPAVTMVKVKHQKWNLMGEVIEVDIWAWTNTNDPDHRVEVWTEGSDGVVRRVRWQERGLQNGFGEPGYMDTEMLEVTPIVRFIAL